MAGDRIVKLVYVDETGLANPLHEPYVIVAANIVDADKKLVAVERHLDKLVERFIPPENQSDFVFHATHLFNGGGKVFVREPKDEPNPKWPLEKRLEIADALAKIPKRFRLPLAVGFVERATFPQTFEFPPDMTSGEKTVAAHVAAFMQCAMSVELWMRRNASDEVCLMVVENNEQARKMIHDTQTYYQNRDITELLETEKEKKYFPFRKIKERPLFDEKRKSSVLQVADFCGYVFKKILMNDSRYDRFWEPMKNELIIDDV